MPDVVWLSPIAEADYQRVQDYITQQRAAWTLALEQGMTALTAHLGAAGYAPSGIVQAPGRPCRPEALDSKDVLVAGRLKDTGAILAKMARYGEPLRVMLDIWGYRLVVAGEPELDAVASSCEGLWATPPAQELLLRHGQLQFAPRRDYRRREHAGLSPATTDRYDQAIHLNRKAPFGIVEIQVMTADLYGRAHCDPASEDSHDQFVTRRQKLFSEGSEP